MLGGLDEDGGLLSLINNTDIIYYEVVRLWPFTNQRMCVHGPVLHTSWTFLFYNSFAPMAGPGLNI